MSVYIDSESKYLKSTLGAEAPTSDEWKLVTCWVKIDSGLTLNSTNVAVELENTDGTESTAAYVQAAVGSTSNALGKGVAASGQTAGSVGSGETLTNDDWALLAALIGPDTGSNTTLKCYSADASTLNSSTTSVTTTNTDTTDWDDLTIGNEDAIGAFTEWKGRIADVAVWIPTSEAQADSIMTEILNGGTPRAANNLPSFNPVWYATLKTDATVTTGASLTENGTPTYSSGDHPTLLEPTPTNPNITAGPTVPVFAETTATVRGTADADCTFQVVILAGHDQTQPNDATFDGSSFNASASANVSQDVGVTGLTGLSPYTAWLRAKGNAGGSSDYGSVNFTTAPAPPTISVVNSGNPLNESASITVTGSGFTGHTAATIDGTAQTNFNVQNDTTVTFTAVLPVGLKFGSTGVLNIGGTTENINMLPESGWDHVDIVDLWPVKADRLDEGQSWSLEDTDQVAWQVTAENVVVNADGRVEADNPITFSAKVFDSTDNTWGSSGNYTLSIPTGFSGRLRNWETWENYANGTGIKYAIRTTLTGAVVESGTFTTDGNGDFQISTSLTDATTHFVAISSSDDSITELHKMTVNAAAQVYKFGPTTDQSDYVFGVDTITGDQGGTGSLASADSVLDATGSRTVNGSSNLASDDSTLSGVGSRTINGSGSLDSVDSSLSGVGSKEIKGTGSPTASDSSLSGSGSRTIVSSGSLVSADSSLSGSGIVKTTGVANLVSSDSALDAEGVSGFVGTGDLVSGDSDLDATVQKTVKVTDVNIPVSDSSLSGVGSRSVSGTATLVSGVSDLDVSTHITKVVYGDIVSGDASISSAGQITIKGTGDLNSGDSTLSGVGARKIIIDIAIQSGDSQLDGTGLGVVTGSGSLISSNSGFDSTGSRKVKGSGVLVSGDSDLTGSGDAGKTIVGFLISGDADLSASAIRIIKGSGVLVSGDSDLNGASAKIITGSCVLISGDASASGFNIDTSIEIPDRRTTYPGRPFAYIMDPSDYTDFKIDYTRLLSTNETLNNDFTLVLSDEAIAAGVRFDPKFIPAVTPDRKYIQFKLFVLPEYQNSSIYTVNAFRVNMEATVTTTANRRYQRSNSLKIKQL